MLVKNWCFCTFLCLALFLRIKAIPSFENNAYRDVTVSLSPRLSPEDCSHSVESTQKILNEASSVLQTAIGARIGSVTFHLPRTCNSSAFPNLGFISTYNNREYAPDIRTTSLTDSAFGKRPIAHQYGGCGVPGLGISIPNEFLTSEQEEGSYSKGKILAREWLKYRYGVFDENGFLEDPMYPTHYSIHGSDEIHITDCTSPKLGYSFRDSENNSCVLTAETAANCSIKPNEEEVGNVKSSLMFYHKELQQLDQICGKDEHAHNIGSMNKQNLICSYKSIWEVLQSHDDFKTSKALSNNYADAEIEYSFVQESELRLAIAWQDTISLKKKRQPILNTVRKLLYDIPLGSKIGFYSFNGDEFNTLEDFQELTQAIRKAVPETNFGTNQEGKPLVALEGTVKVLQADNEEDKPGQILMFTSSDPEESQELIETLKNSKLCINIVGFEGATQEGWNKYLNTSACNSFSKIPDSDDEAAMYEKLYSVVEPIIPPQVEDSKINTISTKILPSDKEIEIPANPSAKAFTVWIHRSVGFVCSFNETVINITKEANSNALVSYSFMAQDGNVKCSMTEVLDQPPLVHVQMTTKEGEYFNNEVFLRDTTPADSTKQMPYIIYAKIFHGEYPVKDADVTAEVTTPNGGKITLILVDDGRGDPDITKNDGIYSKYFTQFDATGTYQVKITATDNKKANASKNGQDPCCGSVIVGDSFAVSEFKWTYETSFETTLVKPEEGYKPSRVTDLRVDAWNLPDSFTLKWTAPGEEMDHGKASNYEFVIFCQHEDCHETGVLPNWISFPSKQKPKDAGNVEALTVHLHQNKPDNTTAYLALKTTNAKQLSSDASNRIYIRLTPYNPQEITTPETKDVHKPPNTPTAGSIVAYVIIAIAILMLICGIIYFLLDRTKRGRQLEELNTPAVFMNTESTGFSFKSISSPADNPIRRAESIPVVLYTHDQIKDYKDKTKQPPLYSTDVAPKPWVSLSALLDGSGSSGSSSTVNVGDANPRY